MNEVNNQVTVEKVKKGVSPAIVFLLVIVFGTIFGVGGWFLGTKYANNEPPLASSPSPWQAMQSVRGHSGPRAEKPRREGPFRPPDGTAPPSGSDTRPRG